MSKLYRARSRLYRRQILQVNIRWKALDEIYKIYMLLHCSDLNISENVRQTFFHFFRAQAVEEALRKDRDGPVEKETPKRKGDKRPRRSAAPSSGCGSVIELAALLVFQQYILKRLKIFSAHERQRTRP